MKQISRIFIISLFVFCIFLEVAFGQPIRSADKISLAVMDFKNNTDIIRYDRLQRAVPEMLKTELSYYQEIVVLEREKIESVLSEMALAQAGFIEEDEAQELGRLAGAEYIITGEINRVGRLLRIDTHLIKVATGQILGEKVSGKHQENIEPMVKLLAQNLMFDLTGIGERKDFARIQNYHTTWFLTATVGLAITTSVYHFSYRDNYKKYHDTADFDKFDYFYKKANNNYKTRNIMMLVTGASLLTTFILWQSEESEKNKLYAHHTGESPKFAQKMNLGFYISDDECFFSLNYRF